MKSANVDILEHAGKEFANVIKMNGRETIAKLKLNGSINKDIHQNAVDASVVDLKLQRWLVVFQFQKLLICYRLEPDD